MHQIQGVKQLLKDKSIDFVEILIDNFLFCDPNSIRDTFGNSQVAFHIMRSHFIERRTDELLSIGKSLRRFNQIIQPMYISDHLAKFYHNNLPLPFIAEIDYKNNIFMLFKKIKLWQEILEAKILLENFPSIMEYGVDQPFAFRSIMKETDCGLLFDVSKAVIASKNLGLDIEIWGDIVKSIQNFHAAAYAVQVVGDYVYCIDTHDGILADDTINWVQEFVSKNPNSERKTLVFEYDDNINHAVWQKQLGKLRCFLS